MPVRVLCPGCRTPTTVPDALFGRSVRCPKCQKALRVGAEPGGRAGRQAIQDAPAARPPRPAAAKPPARPPAPRPPSVRRPSAVPLWVVLVGGGVAAAFFVIAAAGVGAAVWVLHSGPSFTTTPAAAAADPAADNGAPAAGPRPGEPFRLADVRKSVVFIRCVFPGLGPVSGSGFLVSADGLVSTNRHVIQPEGGKAPVSQIMVGVPAPGDPDTLEYYKAQVAYCSADEHRDFALLKIAARPGRPAFSPLPLAPAPPALGDPVAVIGYPGALGDDPHHAHLSFNKGGLSATHVEIDGAPYYQTDAAINHGNSGGPLINADGAVLGVVTLGTNANGTGYALYLSATGLPGLLGGGPLACVEPEPGPVDPRTIPTPTAIRARKANWDVAQARMEEEQIEGAGNVLVVTGEAGSGFWVTSKEALPENFQFDLQCYVPPLRRNRFVANDRQLYVRFDTENTDSPIDMLGPPGTTLLFAPTMLSLWKDGRTLKLERRGIPFRPFLLSVIRQGGDLSVSVDGQAVLQHRLDSVVAGTHKISIGSRISYPLCFGDAAVLALGEGDGPPVARVAPPPANPPFVPPPAPPVVIQPPPAPVAPPAVAPRLGMTVAPLQAKDILPCLCWADGGKSFFVLESTGALRRMAWDGFKEEKKLDTDHPCHWMAMSAKGLAVGVGGPEQVWLVDPATLEVKSKVDVPSAARVAASPALATAFAGNNVDKLAAVDLGAGKVVAEYDGQSFPQAGVGAPLGGPVLSPDGTYLFARGGLEQLHRFKVDGATLTYEEATERILQGPPGEIQVSPDGEYVAAPCGGGNYGTGYGVNCYAVSDLKRVAFLIQPGAYPRTVGFDPARKYAFGHNFSHQLVVFNLSGLKKMEFALASGGISAEPKQFLAHPEGGKLLLLSEDRLSAVTLPPAN